MRNTTDKSIVKLGDVFTILLPAGERLLARVVEVDLPLRETPSQGKQIRNLSEFGKTVRRTRESRGLTQRDLAKICKMSISTINNIENDSHGKRGPNQASINTLKSYFDL